MQTLHILCCFLDFYINGALAVIDFTQYPHGKTYTELLIQKTQDDTSADVYRLVFNGGIAVNIKPQSNLLSVSVALSSNWKGNVKGKKGAVLGIWLFCQIVDSIAPVCFACP